MPPKRAASELCEVCKKKLKIINGDEMRLHLLSEHEQQVADVLYSEKVKASPVLQWIKEYISTATVMMQSAQNNHHNGNNINNSSNGTRKRSVAREEKRQDESFATPAATLALRRSSRTSRSASRELSTPPATKRISSTNTSRESSMERTPSRSSNGESKGSATCHKCGTGGIKQDLKLRHVLQSHLDIPIFTCSLCDYVNNYNRESALKHAQRMHSAKQTDSIIVDNTTKHETVIGDMMEKCFPSNSDRSTSHTPTNGVISRRSSSGPSPPSSTSKSPSKKACGLCGMQVVSEEFVDHAWNEHRKISRRVYRCSKCSYATVENRHRVQTHIGKEHEKDEDVAVVRDEDAEFRKLLEHCFGKEVSEAPGIKAPSGDRGSEENGKENDSKTTLIEPTVDCQLCHAILPPINTALRQHICRIHADRPLFLCSDCSFTNSYRSWAVQQHIRDRQIDGTHQQATVVDYSNLFMPELYRIATDCFPNVPELFQ